MSRNSDDLERRAMHALENAFDQPSDTRKAWVRSHLSNDPELLARVLALLETSSSVSEALRTGGASSLIEEEIPPDRAGQYRIVSLIGRGGMGAVYLGQRDAGDFEHRVAIKVIRPGTLSEALVSRFENERRILAKLNHPGIARLFDGGQLGDGSPFIVMEFVDGVPVTQWVDDQALTTTERLYLFRTICNAVEYAHQNLIIHRDITPSNVLVTPEGEARLIDFGIAKPQAEGLAAEAGKPGPSSPESLSFTPGFAAPERSRGAPANTLSDIYSLGKLLQAMLEQQANDRELGAVIDRACREVPSDRYPSVTALSDDIGNYLTGYPVDACEGGSWYRWRKYLARRRLIVSAAAAAMLTLSAALAVTLVQYQRAETALTRAEARFEQARTLSRRLIFDAYDEFAEVAGTLEARRKLVALVDDYVGQLAADRHAPVDVLFDVGVMKNRLSVLYGGIGWANLGETEVSAQRLLEAEAALENLLAEAPGNAEALAELIMVGRNRSMQALYYDINTDRAMQINDEVLAHARTGLDRFADNERPFLRHLWSARTDRVQILLEMREIQSALSFIQDWRADLDEEMLERLGGGEEMAAYMAVQEAELLNKLDRHGEAIGPIEFALDYRREQLEAEPGNYYQLTQLLVAWMELAESHDKAGQPNAAIAASVEAVQIARQIQAADLNDAGGPEGLNAALTNQAGYFSADGQDEAAIKAALEALSLSEDLVAQFPDDIYFERIRLRSILTLLEVSQARMTDATACASLSEARELFDKLAEGGTESNRLSDRTGSRLAEIAQHRDCSPEPG
jgi:serine/threonine-protein kinase